MASLFDNLPEPRPQEARPQNPSGGNDLSAIVQTSNPDDKVNSAAQHSTHSLAEPQHVAHDQQVPPDTAAASEEGVSDQLTQALSKIAAHISNPSKFAKASALLRQLIDSQTLDKAHRNEYFLAVKAAFNHPESTVNPTLRKEYIRLMGAVNSCDQILGKRERAQLEVYTIWAVTQNELFTDDNFVFNKVVAKIKELINGLSEASTDEEQAWQRLQSGQPSSSNAANHEDPQQQQQEQQQRPRKKAKVDITADPFGLDDLFAADSVDRKLKPKAPSLAWDPHELSVMKKQAVLDCMQTAKGLHKLAWARTSVELLVEHAYSKRGVFVDEQRAVLDELMTFVKQQRVARKSGGGRGGAASDMTAFERARAEWSTATMSHRGRVGGGGDNKSMNWLG
eukprot:jgi/Chrzof1/8397/Cz03g09050.t1